jgi:hypothetical protein
MPIQTFRTANHFSGDAAELVNGLARGVSHFMMAPILRIAESCDVGGILVARRAAWRAGSDLYRAAGREGHRSRRGRLFGCLHYLSELT